MNATVKRGLVRGLMLSTCGLLLGGVAEVRADQVRVAASLPGIAFDFGPHHGAVAIGPSSSCGDEARQIWHEPVYEWRKIWVEVPPVIERRRVAAFSACGRHVGFRYVEVVIAPARRELRTERVRVREGYYETVYEPRCARRAGGFGVAVGSRGGQAVIDHRPRVTRINRVGRGPDVVRVVHPARPYRGDLRVQVRR